MLFNFPDSIWIMALGQALHGVVDPFILVPSLPEMIDSVIDKYPDDEILVNDLSSAIFNCFLGIGQISGPLYGSLMTEYFNFRLTSDYVAILCLFFAVVYFTFCRGPAAFVESKCTNYGEPHHFGNLMTTSLNHSRLMSNHSNPMETRWKHATT